MNQSPGFHSFNYVTKYRSMPYVCHVGSLTQKRLVSSVLPVKTSSVKDTGCHFCALIRELHCIPLMFFIVNRCDLCLRSTSQSNKVYQTLDKHTILEGSVHCWLLVRFADNKKNKQPHPLK